LTPGGRPGREGGVSAAAGSPMFLAAFAIPFPDIDPVLFRFEVFGVELALRWYALAYIAGLVLGWQVVKWLCRRDDLWGGQAPMAPARSDDLLTWMVLGVILGGRLGYVLFYQPAYYAENPADILAIWRGGMSFHGGFLGVVAATAGFAWANRVPVVRLGDAVAVAAPVGMFFGRLANFVNAELWGRPTTLPWGVIFPGPEAQTCPEGWVGVCVRHPSQLYQAFVEGLFVFVLLLWAATRWGWLRRPGRTIGLAMLSLGGGRFFVEFFRQGDPQFVSPENPWGLVIRFGEGIASWGFTWGQILSVPLVMLGLWLIARRRRVAA
jgi:phosphatidylglycerol---prolipoprotein diacylglyceryl transferase